MDVYWNLHQGGFSIRDCATGRVIDVVDEGWILGASFVVNQEGRKRVRRERRKNVHAFIRGSLSDGSWVRPEILKSDLVMYDPYVVREFVRVADLTPIREAIGVRFWVDDETKKGRVLAFESG